ncbi:MAG: hypothetical protein IJA81_05275, partial [Akkermansia sp.]|nr:hypothetical protein [Akkermansia sp.]
SRDFPSNFLSHGLLPPRSCSSGLGFRIIAAPRGLSPQCAYRVGRTKGDIVSDVALKLHNSDKNLLEGAIPFSVFTQYVYLILNEMSSVNFIKNIKNKHLKSHWRCRSLGVFRIHNRY